MTRYTYYIKNTEQTSKNIFMYFNWLSILCDITILKFAHKKPSVYPLRNISQITGKNSESCQTFQMELFVITFNGFQPLTILGKSFILDV